MADLKSGLILEDGESLVMEIEAEFWATSSNPVAMAFGQIKKFFAKIFGYKVNGFLVITNKRVVQVAKEITCYCFNSKTVVKYLLPSSVKEVGYDRKATCGCFCPAFHLYYEGFTERTRVMLAGADERTAQKTVDAFYRAISAAQLGNA